MSDQLRHQPPPPPPSHTQDAAVAVVSHDLHVGSNADEPNGVAEVKGPPPFSTTVAAATARGEKNISYSGGGGGNVSNQGTPPPASAFDTSASGSGSRPGVHSPVGSPVSSTANQRTGGYGSVSVFVDPNQVVLPDRLGEAPEVRVVALDGSDAKKVKSGLSGSGSHGVAAVHPAAQYPSGESLPVTPLISERHHSSGAVMAVGHRDPSLVYSESFANQSYVQQLPPHLMPLAHEIRHLDDEDFVRIAEVTQTMADRDLYSLLPYTGSNWFLPSVRSCREGEKHWEVRYSSQDGLIISIGGSRLSIRALNIFIRLCFIVLVWFMMWNVLPHRLVEPGGYVWDPVVLVLVSAIVGGLVCRVLQLPPLAGVLWIGIMWNNIPRLKYLTHGIVTEVYDISSKLGLTVILARAGYKLALKEIRPHWKQTALLATMPFAFEGVAHSLIANQIFDYNNQYDWAFLQGMLCSIVSPAVVVPGSLYLQDLGYGRGVGPLSLMLSSVGIEIVIGVWCANFLIGMIFYNQNLVVAIILGPVQFVGGILIGVGLGILFFYVVELIKQEAQRLPNGKYTRDHLNSCMDFAFVIFLVACYTMVFFGYRVQLAGGGCVMCVFFCATVGHMWSRTGNAEHEGHKKYLATWLALTWDHAMMPILFATMGAKINVMAIFNASFFPKAIICMACSTAVRVIVIFVVQLGSGMPWREKALVCVGYLGKASAQASVGPIAANLVAAKMAALPADQQYTLETMAHYANNVQQISAMYVMFMAVIASMGLVRGGRLVLKRDPGKEKPNSGLSSGSTPIGAPACANDAATEGKGGGRERGGEASSNVDPHHHRDDEGEDDVDAAASSLPLPLSSRSPLGASHRHHVSFADLHEEKEEEQERRDSTKWREIDAISNEKETSEADR